MSAAAARPKPAVARPVVSLALLAMLTLGALLALERLYHAESTRIRAVEVRGIHAGRVDAAAVRAVVQSALPATYLSVELARLEARIAALPWVFEARLRRRWPDKLLVEVTEVQPVAQWGDEHWLHSTGALVAKPAAANDADWRDLPRLSGPNARVESRAEIWRAFQSWSKAFAAKGLLLDSLRVDARGLCYLELSVSALAAGDRAGGDGAGAGAGASPPPIRLIVARADADARIARFTGALREALIGEFAQLRTVDLRYPNGFALSRAPATVAKTATTATTATTAIATKTAPSKTATVTSHTPATVAATATEAN